MEDFSIYLVTSIADKVILANNTSTRNSTKNTKIVQFKWIFIISTNKNMHVRFFTRWISWPFFTAEDPIQFVFWIAVS